MPQLGDIVRAIERFRSNGREWGTALGIAFQQSDNHGSIGVVFPSGHIQRFSEAYLEVVHPVDSPEAREAHASYPMADHNPYEWFLARANPVVEEAVAEVVQPTSPFAVGDIVRRISNNPRCSFTEEFAVGELGRVNGFLASYREKFDVARITERFVGEGGHCSSHLLMSDFELVAPAAENVAGTEEVRQWRVGDIIRRKPDYCRYTFRDVGDVVITDIRQGSNSLTVSAVSDGRRIGNGWDPEYFDWVSRPGEEVTTNIETQMPIQTIRADNLGLRVRVIDAGSLYHNQVGNVTVGGRGTSIRVTLDPHDLSQDFQHTQLEVLQQEPEMPAFPTNWAPGSHMWLNIEGATKEDCNAFFDTMTDAGFRDIRDRHPDHGTRNELRTFKASGHRTGILIQSDRSILYWRCTIPTRGDLLRDWNKILLAAGLGKPKPEPKKRAKPTEFKALSTLPNYFVLESSGKQGRDAQNTEYFRSAGFHGFAGLYTLFAHNAFVGTRSKAVAERFVAKHNAHWFTNVDSEILERLIVNRKLMRTTNQTTQRFAVDVEASSPVLVQAFLLFLSSIGYRQEDADRTSGPYILLNGGNVGDNQPGTWKYFPTKNNRSLCINLSSEPRTKDGKVGKSGWEDATSRLGSEGVALPILDEDDVDRNPVVNDQVLLLDNAVTEGYPETEAELAALVQGTTYTVTAVRGGRLQLDNLFLVHPDRVALKARKPGVQNGDQVRMITAYGKLAVGTILTATNDGLIDAAGATWKVPPQAYAALPVEELTSALLTKNKLSLPFTARVVDNHPTLAGQEVTIVDAWPLNSQHLAFWTQVNETKDHWLELHEMIISRGDGSENIQVHYADTPEDSKVIIYGREIPLLALQDALAG